MERKKGRGGGGKDRMVCTQTPCLWGYIERERAREDGERVRKYLSLLSPRSKGVQRSEKDQAAKDRTQGVPLSLFERVSLLSHHSSPSGKDSTEGLANWLAEALSIIHDIMASYSFVKFFLWRMVRHQPFFHSP